jgi:hypothetical protein
MTRRVGSMEIERLRKNARGSILLPEEPGYDDARRVWNAMYDRRPAVIVQCTGVADVQEAVQFARENDLVTAIRGGGHSFAGASTIDDGLLIDMRLMDNVRVDAKRRVATAGGGTTWGLFDRETQVHGLASTGGMVSTTGVAGLTLGGGVGRLMRKHGLTCDNVVGYDIVTADSACLHVDADTHPDLFWALKGGGGDFGVVTSFEFKLHQVGPIVQGGFIGWPLDDAPQVFSSLRELIHNAPEELALQFVFTTAPPAEFVPPELHGQPILMLSATWIGDPADGEREIRPFQDAVAPSIDMVGPMPYAVVQGFGDALAPEGRRNYLKSGFFDELSDEVVEIVIGLARRFTSPFSLIELYQMGGAISLVGEDDTVFAGREAGFYYTALGTWEDGSGDRAGLAWCRDLDAAFEPIRRPGRYINFVVEGDDESTREALGAEKLTRLAAVKKKYDPDGLFSRNPNISVRS